MITKKTPPYPMYKGCFFANLFILFCVSLQGPGIMELFSHTYFELLYFQSTGWIGINTDFFLVPFSQTLHLPESALPCSMYYSSLIALVGQDSTAS
jgi:hypothetical protein